MEKEIVTEKKDVSDAVIKDDTTAAVEKKNCDREEGGECV